MKKLKLDVNALSVASFDTMVADADLGTVQGHLVPTNPYCAAHSVKSYCPDTLCTCPPPPAL